MKLFFLNRQTMAVTLVAIFLVSLLTFALSREIGSDVGGARERLNLMRTRPALASGSPSTVDSDFAQVLPVDVGTDQVIADIRRTSADYGLLLTALADTYSSATPGALGKDELAVEMRGTYAKIKDSLAATLDRFAGLRLRHVSIRRVGLSSKDVEASISFVILKPPIQASLPIPQTSQP